MAESIRILVLEDNPADAELMLFELREAGLSSTAKVVMTEKEYVHELQKFSPDLILSDYDLPKYNGALALAEAKRRCPDTPFILVTGAVTEDRAIEILTQGARDYVLKSRLEQRLLPAVRRALAEAEEQKARKRAEDELREAHRTLEERVKIRTAELEAEMAARMKTEEALRESEKRFRTIFEQAAVGVSQVESRTGRFVRINQKYCDIVGYSPEEMLGKSFWDITHPDDLSADAANMARLLGGAVHTYTLEKRYIHKNGTTVWVNLTLSAMWIAGEEPSFHIGVAEDITTRKQTEEMLREQLHFLQQLLDAIPIPIFYKDRQGVFRGCNMAYEKFVGMTKEQVVGKSVHEIFPQDLADIYYQADEALFTQQGAQVYETSFLHADGNRHDIIFNKATYFGTDGCVAGLVGVILDITERKRAEAEMRSLQERLQRAEKMEALGTLAGGVAHDLNNVLGIVVGYAELLLNEVDQSSPIRLHLQNIMTGGERAAAIVQDLLTLARRGVSNRQVLNLNEIIMDCQNLPEFETFSSYHPAVQIRTDLEPDILNISGSSVHLSKTLFNLVSNAAEAMPNGGVLTIKTANRYLDKPIKGYDEVREGDYVVLSVSDTGDGIPAADLKRIFEPFYTKKVMGRSGTGLGLSVVWGTVKDHHGYINVQSEEGKGSTFTLYFPVTREEIAAESVAVSLSEYMGKGESILVVDDVEGQRDLTAEMLRNLNYNVTTAASGEEAVVYLREHTVDLMVLDMIMEPGLDGLETYRSILDVHPKQKAIIVSGFSESERVNAAQALGAGAYVRKPYVIEKIGLAVRKELDRK